jgi:hypothetical protein
MGNRSEHVLAAVLGVGALFILSSALAAPPPSRLIQPRARSQIQTLGQHLDLRAPYPAADAAEKTWSFPSMSRRHSSGSPEQAQLPALVSDGMRSRLGFQDFVRRTQHEGLPVARLFESKSALVHLGFSPKGKPGLWLVQKIH